MATLTFYPAIDLKDGVCVRLVQGKMDDATIFNINPVAQSLLFAQAGCKWLHLVDLNGAFVGQSVNSEVIKRIIDNSEFLLENHVVVALEVGHVELPGAVHLVPHAMHLTRLRICKN